MLFFFTKFCFLEAFVRSYTAISSENRFVDFRAMFLVLFLIFKKIE